MPILIFSLVANFGYQSIAAVVYFAIQFKPVYGPSGQTRPAMKEMNAQMNNRSLELIVLTNIL